MKSVVTKKWSLSNAWVLLLVVLALVCSVAVLEFHFVSKVDLAKTISVLESNQETLESENIVLSGGEGDFLQRLQRLDGAIVQSADLQSMGLKSTALQSTGQHGSAMSRMKGVSAEVSALFQDALHLSQTGNIAESIRRYQQIIKKNPNHQMAVINLALLYKKQGQCKHAIPQLEYALTIANGARKGKTYALLGACHSEGQRYSKAVEYFKRSIDYRPNHPLTWRRFAQAKALAGRPFAEVLDTFDKAIALSPNSKKSVLAKGQFQLGSLDFRGALETLKQSKGQFLPRDKSSKRIAKTLIWSYIELHQYDEADKIIRQLMATERDPIFYEKLLAYVNSAQGNSGLEVIAKKPSKTIRKSSENVIINNDMTGKWFKSAMHAKDAEYLKFLRNLPETIEIGANPLLVYQSLLDDPEYRYRVKFNIANALAASTHYAPALEAYMALQAAPIDGVIVLKRAMNTALKTDQSALAYHLIRQLESENPDGAHHKIPLIQWHLEFGSAQKALIQMNDLLAHDPQHKTARRLRAEMLKAEGNWVGAAADYEKLTQAYADERDLFNYASVLYRARRHAQAVDVLERLLSLKNSHIEGRYLLAKSLCAQSLQQRCLLEAQRIQKLDQTHSGAAILMAKAEALL